MSGPESWGMLVSSLGQWGDHVLFPYRSAIFHEKRFLWTYYYFDKSQYGPNRAFLLTTCHLIASSY